MRKERVFVRSILLQKEKSGSGNYYVVAVNVPEPQHVPRFTLGIMVPSFSLTIFETVCGVDIAPVVRAIRISMMGVE